MLTQKEKFARWPSNPTDLISELRAFEQGVPALVQLGHGQWEGQKQILLCTSVYYLLAVPPDQGNNYYFVPWMKPTDLHQLDRLAQGSLILKAKGWHIHTTPATVPVQGNNGLSSIWNEWQTLQTELKTVSPPAYTLTPVHESYLNTIDKLIDVIRELVLDKAALFHLWATAR